MSVLRRLWSFVRRPSSIGPRLMGAVTLLAFTDSGWMRRLRVPKLAVSVLAGLVVALALAAIVSVSFAVRAGVDLRRLKAVERENRSLTSLLREQASQLLRLQGEMSRLHELEKSLRAVSGLADRAEASDGPARGGGLPSAPPR